MRYQVCGLLLASEMALPELTGAAETEPKGSADLRVRLARRGEAFPSPSQWSTSWTLPTGEP
jgi:hypothetical protein